MLLAVTSDTWIVTGLGFGIVLALLFCLVFIMMLFGYLMQKATKPAASSDQPKVQSAKTKTDEAEIAAVAYALYLYEQTQSDPNISMITLNKRETAWNPKSNGFNNVGF